MNLGVGGHLHRGIVYLGQEYPLALNRVQDGDHLGWTRTNQAVCHCDSFGYAVFHNTET
jgi:hypothetical protein